MKARSREHQMLSVGKLWTEEDFHCMVMNIFCEDIAKSPDHDITMATMRKIFNWNKNGQHPSGIRGLSSRGDDLLHKRLKSKFLGIKLFYQEQMIWIHNLVLVRKRGDNKYVLIAINDNFM